MLGNTTRTAFIGIAALTLTTNGALAQNEIALARSEARANLFAQAQSGAVDITDEGGLDLNAQRRLAEELYRFDQRSSASAAFDQGPSAESSVAYAVDARSDAVTISLDATVSAALSSREAFDEQARANLELTTNDLIQIGGTDGDAPGFGDVAEITLRIAYTAPAEGTANSEVRIELNSLTDDPRDFRFNNRDALVELVIRTPLDFEGGTADRFGLDIMWTVFGDADPGSEQSDLFTRLDVDASFRVVPTPGSAMLLGLAGLVATRRRR